MNEELFFNDTFDDLSFSVSGNCLNKYNKGNTTRATAKLGDVAEEVNENRNIQNKDEHENISVDDSAFFNEFNFSQVDAISSIANNKRETKKLDESNNSNITPQDENRHTGNPNRNFLQKWNISNAAEQIENTNQNLIDKSKDGNNRKSIGNISIDESTFFNEFTFNEVEVINVATIEETAGPAAVVTKIEQDILCPIKSKLTLVRNYINPDKYNGIKCTTSESSDSQAKLEIDKKLNLKNKIEWTATSKDSAELINEDINLQQQLDVHDSKEKVENKDIQLKKECKLSEWGLPNAVLEKYESRKITSMFQWQVECLSNPDVLQNKKNLVYSAPTSAGKTLVAEILAIKTVVEHQKKVLFILPFVSVVREKMFYFQDILGSSGIRVEGFMGSYNPPGGFPSVQVAICTIEKANSIVNRLLEEESLADIGAVVVDEMHLLGDYSRGYQLELLLTKLRYMSVCKDDVHIQIIGMSATLPNLSLLAKWLDAELYTTTFRPIPLYEQCHVNGEIYDNSLKLQRNLSHLEGLDNDTDNILQLCLETIFYSCSVLIFCPTKNWCENLSQQIAMAFWRLGRSNTPLGDKLRAQLKPEPVREVLEQLKCCPVGLDRVLGRAVSYAAAYHHAGLTMDERDIIEGAFRSGAIRVLVATSTLSSGVNLPARRVIIRTPKFHGKTIDTLTYRQMIGRAGRMGKDTAGESILICQKTDNLAAKELMSAKLKPIESCLDSSGKLKRAILEVIASGVASTPDDVALFTSCTLLAAHGAMTTDPIEAAVNFLKDNEFIRLQKLDDGTCKYYATPLAKACLSSSMPPEEGLALFAELQKARQCFVLETELHLIYLVTPYSACNQWGNIDWMMYLDMWERLSVSMKRVGELVGVAEVYIVNRASGKIEANTDKGYHKQQVHKRFYTALALQDLVNEVPLNEVAQKFNCSRGMLQSLQQSSSSFAGMVTSFSRQLGWSSVEILVSQFQDRMQFGVSRELLDLMRLPLLNGPRARALYNNGIETLVHLASTDPYTLENVLYKATPFESEKEREGESEYQAERRNKLRTIWVQGKQGLTTREAADMLIAYSRKYLQLEMGMAEVKWQNDEHDVSQNREASYIKENSTSVVVKAIENPLLHTQPKDITENEKIPVVLTNISEQHSTPNKTDEHELSKDAVLSPIANQSNNCDMSSQSLFNDSSKSAIAKLDQNVFSDNSFLDEAGKKIDDVPKESIKTNNDSGCYFKNESMENVFAQSFNESLKSENVAQNNVPLRLQKTCTFQDISWDAAGINFDSFRQLEKQTSVGNEIKNTLNNSGAVDIERKETNNSNDFIANSQAEIYSICSIDSPNCLQRSSRKRSRTMSRDLVSCSDEESVAQTPTKKTKTSRTKRKEKSAIYFITEHGLVCNTKNALICCNKLEIDEHPAVDLTNLEIIDVCANRKLFDCFKLEIVQKKQLSLSVACAKLMANEPKIGQNIISKDLLEPEEANDVPKFAHKDRRTEGVSVAWGTNTAYYVSFDSQVVSDKESVELLREVLSKSDVCIKMFDCKEQVKVLKLCCNVDFKCAIEDPKVADWLLQPEEKQKNLQAMTLLYAPEALRLTQLIGTCKGVGSIGLDLHTSFKPKIRASVESVVSWHLCESVKEALREQSERMLVTYGVEMQTTLCLAKMELDGFGVDVKTLKLLAVSLTGHCEDYAKKAYQLAGRRFSFTSSADVAKVLGMYKGRRVSTNKQTLEQSENPISALILMWRKMNCALTKMVYPLLRLVECDRIHGNCITFNSTGRICMHEPNVQNVARDFEVRDPFDRTSVIVSCRTAFVADKGNVLVSADYCQLELRLLAHLCQDPLLCSIMRSGEDVFKSVAAKWNGVMESQVDDQMRQNTKQICYGIIYGMGKKTLAEQLSTTEEKAAEFVETFHKKYVGIRKFILATVENCRTTGYVETLTGRRRYLPHINHQPVPVMSQAERQAVNTTIQGSAADIAKNAMVVVETRIEEKFKSSKNRPKLVLHLHDELLYEVPSKYTKTLARILKKSMEESVRLSVPFPVKLKSGRTWGTMEELLL